MTPQPQRIQVFLDFDSTLTALEGYDELARMRGTYRRVSALTRQAMAGRMDFLASLRERLDLIRPDASMLDELARRYRAAAVAGVTAGINKLREQGMRPVIVSGGPQEAILPFAARIGIPARDVLAVSMRLDARGAYRGFDRRSAVLRPGGKASACRARLKARDIGVVVGDGASDAEAKDAELLFIQYAGVVDRKEVRPHADAVIRGRSLRNLDRHVLRAVKQRYH